jgi:hypothetical protein
MWAPLGPDLVGGPTPAYEVDLDGGGITPPGPLGGGSVFRARSGEVNSFRLRNGAILDGSNLAAAGECISRIRPSVPNEVVLTVESYGGVIGPKAFLNPSAPTPSPPFPPIPTTGIVSANMDAKTTINPAYQAPGGLSPVGIQQDLAKRDTAAYTGYDDALVAPPLGVNSVQDAIDALKVSGRAFEFVFDTAATQSPIDNLYSVWSDLCDAILALPYGALPRIVFVQPTFTVPLAGMPANGWYMGMGSWVAPTFNTGNVTVTIEDGAMIDSLSTIADGLAVTAAPSADGVFNWRTYASSHPMAPWILSVQYGASLFNGSPTGKALIGPTPGTGQFVVVSSAAATLTSGTPPPPPPLLGPFLKLTAGDVAIGSQMEPGFYGNLPDGWISGDGNLLYQNGTDARTPITPGFIGATFPLNTFQQVLNPLALKGARKQLIFTDVVPAGAQTDTFNDWAKMYAVWSLIDGPKDIVFSPTKIGRASCRERV